MRLFWTSTKGETMIEVNSIDDLLNLIRTWGHPLVVSEKAIEIYDDYRE